MIGLCLMSVCQRRKWRGDRGYWSHHHKHFNYEMKNKSSKHLEFGNMMVVFALPVASTLDI